MVLAGIHGALFAQTKLEFEGRGEINRMVQHLVLPIGALTGGRNRAAADVPSCVVAEMVSQRPIPALAMMTYTDASEVQISVRYERGKTGVRTGTFAPLITHARVP